MPAERRRFRRVQFPVCVGTTTRGVYQAHEMTAVNISAGGMLLRTAHIPDIGEEVLLVFTLPDTQREIRVTGTVLHVKPGGYMGIRFDNLSAENKEAIDKFVELAVPVPKNPAE